METNNYDSFTISGLSQTTFTGGPKISTFCQRSYRSKCERRGVGGQKKPKYCQRTL